MIRPVKTDLVQLSSDRIIADENSISYVRRKLLEWGRTHFDDFPWRNSTNEFHTLVGEILLQRTKAPQVVPTYLNFIMKYPDPQSLANASIQEVETIIWPLGLRWRAKLLVQLGKSLKQFDWIVPDEDQLLKCLPGVGTYVSSAYLSLHRDKRAPIVDSNIVRFYGRYFGFYTGTETRRNKAVISLASQITPERTFRIFNYALIDFTRIICKPKPYHGVCPIKRKCWLYKNAA